jgi:hypothetical protein
MEEPAEDVLTILSEFRMLRYPRNRLYIKYLLDLSMCSRSTSLLIRTESAPLPPSRPDGY